MPIKRTLMGSQKWRSVRMLRASEWCEEVRMGSPAYSDISQSERTAHLLCADGGSYAELKYLCRGWRNNIRRLVSLATTWRGCASP